MTDRRLPSGSPAPCPRRPLVKARALPSASAACSRSTASTSTSRAADRVAHRPQRRRQDDVLQHDHRRTTSRPRARSIRRAPDRVQKGSKLRSLKPHEVTRAGDRPDVPEHPPVRRHVRARQRARRHARPPRAATGRDSVVAHARDASREEQASIDRGDGLLELVGIGTAQTTRARNLPYGDQRRLEIARALRTEPKLLLLDEPAAGMNPQEKRELMDLIR